MAAVVQSTADVAERTVGLVYYAISVLSGLAATQMPSRRSVCRRETERGHSKDTLACELGRCAK